MKAIALFFIALILLSGCATSAIPINDAVDVQTDRIFLNNQLNVEGNAVAVFVRDVGFMGCAVYEHLFIDGKKAASLNPGEKVEFMLPPGEHIFGVIPTDPFGTHALNSIDQDLKPDKRYFYRIYADGNSMRTEVQRYVPVFE